MAASCRAASAPDQVFVGGGHPRFGATEPEQSREGNPMCRGQCASVGSCDLVARDLTDVLTLWAESVAPRSEHVGHHTPTAPCRAG